MTPSQPFSSRRGLVALKTTTSLVALSLLLLLHLPSPTLSKDTHRFPDDFQLSDALNYFHVESASLLKRSLLEAGFDVEDTLEVSETYLDFATRALTSEARRIERIKETLRRRPQDARDDDPQSCSSADSSTGQCIDSSATSRAAKSSPEFAHFLTPDLTPGQTDLLRWQDDGSLVQDYAARIGLPPQLIPTLRSYAEEMGLLEVMTNMLYEDPLPPGGSRFFTFSSPYQREQLQQSNGMAVSEIRNFTWNVERPEKKWKSDMHWFNTADELSHEDALRALAKGGFDLVLEAIGKEFGLDHLHVDSVGFVAVTNCDRGFVHTDWEDVDGRAFNFLVGISNPEHAGPELIVESDRGKGEVNYGSNAGILVGDGTRHGTRECDHRAQRGVRITCSIYLADLNEKNLEVIAGDTTSIFPPTGDEEWVWSQRGRHWSKEGGRSLVGDLGRTGLMVEDEWEDCEERVKKGGCVGDTEERTNCLRTCEVYIHDSVYKPGEERRKVLGY